MQTVIFPRLAFWGVMPDLILVSVIAFTVLNEEAPSTLFSAVSAFLQDLLSTGIYINTMIKVLVGAIVSRVKEEFAREEYSLIAGLVALLTPVLMLLEWAFYHFFFGIRYAPLSMFFKIAVTTIYNLVLVPLVLPVVARISNGD